MTQKYYTYNQAIAHCDATVMRAKVELAQEIAIDRKFIQSCCHTHA